MEVVGNPRMMLSCFFVKADVI